MATFFNEYFDIPEEVLEDFGAFNVSLVNDLPLFIDPFLLFHSESEEYQQLHQQMIQYVIFLRDRAAQAAANDDLLKAWYCFPEIRQNWLGFSVVGNRGSGLGMKFARALNTNLGRIFSDFGEEKITSGRGPVDFKISWGAHDKTLVEMKLAKNSQLERNLAKQVPIYQAASDAEHAIKAIIFFSQAEQERAEGILDKLGLLGHRDIVLIDARADNKPSGSKA